MKNGYYVRGMREQGKDGRLAECTMYIQRWRRQPHFQTNEQSTERGQTKENQAEAYLRCGTATITIYIGN